MNYQKPELTQLAPAIQSVQSSSNKANPRTPDSAQTQASAGAYESDE